MKKRVFWIWIVLLLLVVCASYLRNSNIRYPAGKDTVQSFGDGTFQIISGTSEGLFNEKYGSCIIGQVQDVYEVGDKVYVIGSTVHGYVSDGEDVEWHDMIYAVIKLSDNTMQLFAMTEDTSKHDVYIYRLEEMLKNNDVQWISEFLDFDESDQIIFEKMIRK